MKMQIAYRMLQMLVPEELLSLKERMKGQNLMKLQEQDLIKDMDKEWVEVDVKVED